MELHPGNVGEHNLQIMQGIEFGSFDYFSNLNIYNSNSISGLISSPIILLLTFLSLYYGINNYYDGIQGFMLSRSKNPKERIINRIKYTKSYVMNDIIVLLYGILVSIIINGLIIDSLGLFLISLLKFVILYSLYYLVPIIVANNKLQYYITIIILLVILPLLIVSLTTFQLIIAVVVILLIVNKIFNYLVNKYEW